MKILQFILAALFFLFAFFQFNDPDPIIWVSLYVIVGLFSLAGALGYYNKYALIGAMVVCLVGGILTFPGVMDYITNQDGYTIMEGMSNDRPYIELTREFGGLIITLGTLVFLYFQGKKKQTPPQANAVS